MKAKNLKIKKIVLSVMAVAAALSTAAFAGCKSTASGGTSSSSGKYIVSTESVKTDGKTKYTITYSDGTTDVLEISDGEDGDTLSVDDLYAQYLENNPGATYDDFLQAVVSTSVDNEFTVSNQALRSSLKVYSEFTEAYQSYSGMGWNQHIVTSYQTNIYCGSAVIYSINSDYTYMITNYHVLYDSYETNTDKLAEKITCYLYGSEGEPTATTKTDSNGCKIYDYGDYAIECEYVGGSITADLAVIRAETADIYAINDSVAAIEFADEYRVGESAVAIGNSENEGISVTSGIVSVDNEFISYSIDGTARQYRSMRIDTAIYGGNSGGGLFNSKGQLIGITNAGDSTDQNINYAIPVDIVKPVVESIMNYKDGTAKVIKLGITVEAKNSKYVYDEDKGYGRIYETVTVTDVSSSSIASTVGLQTGDALLSMNINGTDYAINRYFDIGDYVYTVREGDEIYFTFERDSNKTYSTKYTVKSSDITSVS